ncbi:MAG TPA: MFS transporter [Mycobacteriales bacterium]|jgi:predicted MFS family arabinose efflux permease|nr:MFS transporter [Mycobacteriales bacterium]
MTDSDIGAPPADAPPTGDGAVRAAAGAVTATVAVVVPVFLLGGLSVLIARDLHFSAAGLGGLVSVYFTVCAVCSVPTGRLVERYGPQRATRAGIVLSAVAMALIAVAARSYVTLFALVALAGAANALGQLGSNLSLARSVPPHRQGLSFGVKQAAIPISTLVAGVAVPVIGLTLGWRWAFGLAALVSLGALAVVPPERGGTRRGRPHERSARTRALVVVGVAAMLASGTANALGSFLVASAVDRGVAEGAAGLVLAAGSALGIAGRIAAGWLADRRTGGHLLVVTGMLVSGAFGLALLAVPGPAAMLIGTLAGFGLGWAWPGLLNFAVVRLESQAPAAATSITSTGVYAGGAAGPLAFGGMVHTWSYPTAWLVTAVVMVLAAGLMLAGRSLLLGHPRPAR